MGPKKKMTGKERARLEAEKAELARIEMEKERSKRLEEERKRKQRELEEAERRQKQEIIDNTKRRKQLEESMRFFDEIGSEIEAINQAKKEEKEWDHYMRCSGLPDVTQPGDLRKHIHIWSTDMIQQSREERNWLLKTNERSILTQNRDVPDLTRESIRKQQGNLGDIYVTKIREILGILDEVDGVIRQRRLPKAKAKDLENLKYEFRTTLEKYLDNYTFKIISNADRDMITENLGMAKHFFESDTFKSQILNIQGEIEKNVKDKSKQQSARTELDFADLQLQLSLPVTIKVQNLSIQILWLSYDHFSDYCPTYVDPNAERKHPSILQQVKREWRKRKQILQMALDHATKETTLTELENGTVEHTVINVDKVFAEYEDEINKRRRKRCGPESLHLGEFDVNLRSHRIIGGVYCTNFFELPEQHRRLNATSFIRTSTSSNELKRKSFVHHFRPPPPPPPGARRLPEEIEAEMNLIESGLEKLILVTLQLPDAVTWFEPPTVCRWETVEEALEAEMHDKGAESQRKKEQRERRRSSYKATVNLTKEVEDFNLFNIPPKADVLGLLVEFVVPRLPPGCYIRLIVSKPVVKTSLLHLVKQYQASVHRTTHPIVFKQASEVVGHSDSPRPLFPKLQLNRFLRIKQDGDASYEADDSQNGTLSREGSREGDKVYMFSELIQDLDRIMEGQMPFFDLDAEESDRCSALTIPRDYVPRRKFSEVIILRESDVSKVKGADDSDSDGDDLSEEETKSLEDGFDEDNLKGTWNTRDIHDTKFNEDKLSIQFRAGRLGYFGFAANRYSNMPYQTWDMKPDLKNPGVILFSLTAAIINIEIQMSKDGFCITNLQGGSTKSIDDITGKFISMDELKSVLITSSIDLFPDEDAFFYMEGSCEKNYGMEMHLYNCMSTLVLTYNFSWSRWNLLSGSRAAILLMREMIENKKLPNHSTLHVSPLRTIVVDCTEVSPSFNASGVPGMDFYADLYQLSLAHSLPISLEKQRTMDPVLRDNVAQLLMSTRPLSLC